MADDWTVYDSCALPAHMRLRRDLVWRAGREDDRTLLVDAIQNAILTEEQHHATF